MMNPVQSKVAHPAAGALAVKAHREKQVKDQPPVATPTAKTTVTVSAAGLAAAASAKEASETPAQTAREASHSDQQAMRLLAKEAAAKNAK